MTILHGHTGSSILTPTLRSVRMLAAFRVVDCFFLKISKYTLVDISPTLDNFKFLIMMNQKETNAQKELGYFEGGNRAWSALACPLSDEECPLHLPAVGLYNKHVKRWEATVSEGQTGNYVTGAGCGEKAGAAWKAASNGGCCQATLSWGTSSGVSCSLNPPPPGLHVAGAHAFTAICFPFSSPSSVFFFQDAPSLK